MPIIQTFLIVSLGILENGHMPRRNVILYLAEVVICAAVVDEKNGGLPPPPCNAESIREWQ